MKKAVLMMRSSLIFVMLPIFIYGVFTTINAIHGFAPFTIKDKFTIIWFSFLFIFVPGSIVAQTFFIIVNYFIGDIAKIITCCAFKSRRR